MGCYYTFKMKEFLQILKELEWMIQNVEFTKKEFNAPIKGMLLSKVAVISTIIHTLTMDDEDWEITIRSDLPSDYMLKGYREFAIHQNFYFNKAKKKAFIIYP